MEAELGDDELEEAWLVVEGSVDTAGRGGECLNNETFLAGERVEGGELVVETAAIREGPGSLSCEETSFLRRRLEYG